MAADPISRSTRRKAAKNARQAEIKGEKRPRGQHGFVKEARQATKLPKIGGNPLTAGIGEEKPIGKKKMKKLQVKQAKESRKAQKKREELMKQHKQAGEALAGKVKVKRVGRGRILAREALAALKTRTPETEQRLLASIAERITANPQEDIDLFDVFFELHIDGADKITKQLALLSAVAVFRDLVPGYRIKESTNITQERKKKVTLALEKQEMTLLQTYRRLFPFLESALKLDPVAYAPALAALVKSAADFNYQQRLMDCAVRHANSHLELVRRVVGEAIQEMVENDTKLEASKVLVLAIGGVAQAAAARRGRGLHPELLHVLLRLPVGRAEEAELHGEGHGGLQDEEMQKLVQESSIRHGIDQLHKGEAELLYEVFCVYLRIIRQRGSHSRELIAAALGGLAKWGQQVNLELLLEILKELKLTVEEAVQKMDELVSLQGLHCALQLLMGPAKALVTDATWIPDALTAALRVALPSLYSTHSEGSKGWPPLGCYVLDDGALQVVKKELDHALEESSTPALVLRCLDAAMRCSHGFGGSSDGSLAALLEQLGLLAVSVDPHVSVAILKEIAALLKRHRKLHTLLDVEGGLFGLGGVEDRALSIAWPLHALASSMMPWPSKAGKNLAATVSSRRGLLSDVFPGRDGMAWLECEFPIHLAGLLEVKRPTLLPAAATAEPESGEEGSGGESGEEGTAQADVAEDEVNGKDASADKSWGKSTLEPGAISKNKRRRTTFWSELQAQRLLRLDAQPDAP